MFISNDMVEAWCVRDQMCPHSQRRFSKAKRLYYYCIKHSKPCYLVLEICKNSLNKTRVIKLDRWVEGLRKCKRCGEEMEQIDDKIYKWRCRSCYYLEDK